MSLSSDINSIVKVKKIKEDLPELPGQKKIDSVRGGTDSGTKQNDGDIVWPATLEVTLETQAEMEARPDQGWIYQDNDNTKPGVQVKRGKTAKLIDALENEFNITEITFVEPV